MVAQPAVRLVAMLEESVAYDRLSLALDALVETYFREGGLHLQLNHVSRETLLDAQANPDAHRSLRVRISGFSAYFTRLRPTMQDEVIARTPGAV